MTRVLGLDPGFASIGYAVLELEHNTERLITAGVLKTAKSPKKAHVLACEDNFERAREIVRGIDRLIEEHRVAVICAEGMSFPRQSSVAAKMAMCWGVLAAASEKHRLPMVQPTPQRVKKLLCGAITASKTEVEDAVRRRYPAASDILARSNKGNREHIADAIAVVVASLDGEVLRMARPRKLTERHLSTEQLHELRMMEAEASARLVEEAFS